MAPTDDSRELNTTRPAISAAALALLLYSITLGGTYIYDDRAIIPLDPRVTQSLWRQFWTRAYFDGAVDNLYRPLVSMSYGIQWMLHGDRPWAFHLVNVLLHACVAAAVAELTRRCAGRTQAYIAGLLFAAHPVHVEAVANIVGRAELMCALAFLGALLIFSKRPLTPLRIAGIFTCLVISILSKEQGMLLPLILLIFGWFVWRQSGPPDSVERSRLKGMILLLSWCTAGYLIFREHFLRFNWDRSFLDWAIQPMVRCAGADRWLMPLVLLGHYFQLLLMPFKLSPDYGARVIGWTVRIADPYFWIGIIAIVLWFVAAIHAWLRRDGFSIFCLLSLAFTYGIVANFLILIGTNLSERLMYLPSAFLVMYVAGLLARLPRKFCILTCAILLALASIRSFTYALRWNNRLDFYLTSLAEQPLSVQLNLLAAHEYIEMHQPTAAETLLARACELVPDSWQLWLRRSMAAMDMSQLEKADEYIRRASQLDVVPQSLFEAQARLQLLKDQHRAASSRPSASQADPQK